MKRKILFRSINLLIFICLFSCTTEDNLDLVDDDVDIPMGVNTLVLSGDISDAEAVIEIDENVGVNTKIIIIENTTQLTNVHITGISKLLRVQIQNNEVLGEVSFPDVSEVDSQLTFTDNVKLHTLSLPSLKVIGELVFDNNDAIKKIDYDLLNITSGNFSVTNNELLEVIDFQSLALQTLPANSQITILNNAVLKSISAPLVKKANNLKIELNNTLETINFSGLENVTGDFNISDNDILPLLYFPVLEKMERGIRIVSDDSVVSLDFPNLTDLEGELFLSNLDALTTINFPKLKNIGNSFVLQSSDLITSVEFPELYSVNGSIDINGNLSLESINFNSLDRCEGLITIGRMNSLNTVSFPKITYAGDMDIREMSAHVLNFPILKTIEEDLVILYNDSLREVNFGMLEFTDFLYFGYNNLSSINIWSFFYSKKDRFLVN